MGAKARIAVLGLYNSGSTVTAGMLHRLGVNMGPPFWLNSDDDDEENFYEPYDMTWHLQRWWDEPRVVEKIPAATRICFFEQWAATQDCLGPGPMGAKHPLLSLCGPDLISAWGSGLRLVWSWRPLEESVAGLQRRDWFKPHEIPPMQQKLWAALNEFERSHPQVVRIDWRKVKADPAWAAKELASVAGVQPTEAQLKAAADFVRPESSKRSWWPFGRKK